MFSFAKDVGVSHQASVCKGLASLNPYKSQVVSGEQGLFMIGAIKLFGL